MAPVYQPPRMATALARPFATASSSGVRPESSRSAGSSRLRRHRLRRAVFGWQVPGNYNPGGNFYLHHNYGTFGTGFSGFGGSNWGYVFQSANVEGSSIPN